MNDAAYYLTDDRDLPEDELRALVIFPGGNGDWYVQVTPAHGRSMEGVRICTSGGAATRCPGLPLALAAAYRALRQLEATPTDPDGHGRWDELAAWRARFPDLRYVHGQLVPVETSTRDQA